MMSQLVQAQAAVEGFVLANHRLPCAAVDTAGREDCSAAAEPVFLPWRTLGLSGDMGGLRYGVNRGGGVDLAGGIPASVSPDLNLALNVGVPQTPDISGFPVTEKAQIDAATLAVQSAQKAADGRRAVVNGLDWCHVLRRFAANTGAVGALAAGNATDSMPVAYVLVHPGGNGSFDGNNAVGARFDFPGRVQSHDFDDLTLAAGPGDLSARMGCPARLGAMQAAAQGAYTGYDNARVVQQYWSLLVFDIEQAESAVDGAITGVSLAAMNLALATASEALAIASALNTEGMTVFGVVSTVVNLGLASLEVGLAAVDLDAAKADLKDAKSKEFAVHAYMIDIYGSFAQALNSSVLLDAKGLNP